MLVLRGVGTATYSNVGSEGCNDSCLSNIDSGVVGTAAYPIFILRGVTTATYSNVGSQGCRDSYLSNVGSEGCNDSYLSNGGSGSVGTATYSM